MSLRRFSSLSLTNVHFDLTNTKSLNHRALYLCPTMSVHTLTTSVASFPPQHNARGDGFYLATNCRGGVSFACDHGSSCMGPSGGEEMLISDNLLASAEVPELIDLPQVFSERKPVHDSLATLVEIFFLVHLTPVGFLECSKVTTAEKRPIEIDLSIHQNLDSLSLTCIDLTKLPRRSAANI